MQESQQVERSSAKCRLLDEIAMLHSINLWLLWLSANDQVNQNQNQNLMTVGGVPMAPPLAEELLAVDGDVTAGRKPMCHWMTTHACVHEKC